MGTVTVSLPHDMLEKMERIIKEEGYAGRSELVRGALRQVFSEISWMRNLEGMSLAVITMTFNVAERGTLDQIGRIEHKYEHQIMTGLRNHMGDICFDVMITKGDTEKIKELIKRLRNVRGVETVRSTVVCASSLHATGSCGMFHTEQLSAHAKAHNSHSMAQER